MHEKQLSISENSPLGKTRSRRPLALPKRMVSTLALLGSLVPLLLFAYLGQYSRLMADDYGHLGKALESGTWEALLFWREYWNGDYTNFLLYGLLAPLGATAPSVFPTCIILIGIFGFRWLGLKLLAFLEINRNRYLIALSLASLILTASINGFNTEQVFFWLSASLEYTWPVLTLLVGLAAVTELGSRISGNKQLSAAALAVCLGGFLNAGFSEMYMVFQLVFAAFMVVCAYTFVDGPKRRAYLILGCAAFVGTLVSLPVQLTAPGIILRSSLQESWGVIYEPVRDLPALLVRTWDETLKQLVHPRAFAGFMLLAAAGLSVTLKLYQPNPRPGTHLPQSRLAASPLWCGILIQLIFAPVLWLHTSDNPDVFARFSYPYTSVIVLNLTLILVKLAAVRRQDVLHRALTTSYGFTAYCSAILLTSSLLFALTQIRSIHFEALTFLFVSALTLPAILCWQLTSILVARDDRQAKRLALPALLSSMVTVLAYTTLVAVSLWGQGLAVPRIFAPGTFLLMASGLLWGACIGALIKRACPAGEARNHWFRRLSTLSLLFAASITTGIVIGRAKRMDDFAVNARLWDQTHLEIMRLRDAGDPGIHTRKFPIHRISDSSRTPPTYRHAPLSWRQKMFYSLDYDIVIPARRPAGGADN